MPLDYTVCRFSPEYGPNTGKCVRNSEFRKYKRKCDDGVILLFIVISTLTAVSSMVFIQLFSLPTTGKTFTTFEC